jgi:hypothetical protein
MSHIKLIITRILNYKNAEGSWPRNCLEGLRKTISKRPLNQEAPLHDTQILARKHPYLARHIADEHNISVKWMAFVFCPQSAFMCLRSLYQQTAVLTLKDINELVFVIETSCVFFLWDISRIFKCYLKNLRLQINQKRGGVKTAYNFRGLFNDVVSI